MTTPKDDDNDGGERVLVCPETHRYIESERNRKYIVDYRKALRENRNRWTFFLLQTSFPRGTQPAERTENVHYMRHSQP